MYPSLATVGWAGGMPGAMVGRVPCDAMSMAKDAEAMHMHLNVQMQRLIHQQQMYSSAGRTAESLHRLNMQALGTPPPSAYQPSLTYPPMVTAPPSVAPHAFSPTAPIVPPPLSLPNHVGLQQMQQRHQQLQQQLQLQLQYQQLQYHHHQLQLQSAVVPLPQAPLTGMSTLAYPQHRQDQRMPQEHIASFRRSQQRQFAAQFGQCPLRAMSAIHSGHRPSAPLPPAQSSASAAPSVGWDDKKSTLSQTGAALPDSGAPQSMEVEKAAKRQRLDDASVLCCGMEREPTTVPTSR